MVIFITFLQSTQDRNRACRIRFVYHDGLESSFECFILFKIFLIFIKGSSTDTSQFATCQGRFQDVCSIHGTFTFSGTYQCMDFIDEQDDISIRFGYFVDNRLQSFFEFAFVFCTCNQRTHVERKQLLVFQVLRNISTQDSLSQSFYDCCLTCTRFTNQDRIVFGTTAQDLQYTTDFFITTDYRVQLAVTCSFYQVDSIFAE